MTLHVPTVETDADPLAAALAYAKAGWYVLPIDAGTKKPASELGKDWGAKSSRDADQLAAWFAGTDYGIGLHVGRSGAVAFDVDHPEQIPEPLQRAITECDPPHQRTRLGTNRGHYLFTFRAGRVLGNGTGRLGGAWGEVRGRGGQIVVAPTPHADGGLYHWVHAGPVPELPAYVDELLGDATPGMDAATDAEVRTFLTEHTDATRPELLDGWVTTFEAKVAEGESRHMRMLSVAAGAFCEARAGYFPARAAMERLEAAFLAAVTRDPLPGSQQRAARGKGMAASEWMGISAWAVAQANDADIADIRARVAEKMPDGDDLSWIPGYTEGGGADPKAEHPPADPTGSARFFDKHEGLLALQLAKAVLNLGPLTSGDDGSLYRYDAGVWRRDGERVIRERVVELLADRYRMAYASTVVDMLRSREPMFAGDRQDDQYLNLPNGLLDWRTGELWPHDPDVPSMIRLPIEWDPDATCPQIEQWMSEVFPDDAREFIEEVIGYALLNDNPLHKAILLFGRGRNGKGTFLRLLKALIGDANISAVTPQSLDENRFRAAELYGKLANLVGDVDPRIFKATETFKQITGGDMIVAERKFGQPFTFYCRALMVAAFNALPRSADTSDGFFSRWIVVPFTGYFPPGVADPGREDKMHDAAELRGLLTLAVRGLQRLMGRRRFDLPPSVLKATAEFRRTADPVRAWLDEYVSELNAEWVPRTQVYRAYDKWAEENGYASMGAASFYERIEAASNDLPTHRIRASKRMGTRGYAFDPREEPKGQNRAKPGAGSEKAAPKEPAGQANDVSAAGAEGAASTHFFKSHPPAHAGGVSSAPAPPAPAAPMATATALVCSCGWGPGALACRCGGAP